VTIPFALATFIKQGNNLLSLSFEKVKSVITAKEVLEEVGEIG